MASKGVSTKASPWSRTLWPSTSPRLRSSCVMVVGYHINAAEKKEGLPRQDSNPSLNSGQIDQAERRDNGGTHIMGMPWHGGHAMRMEHWT